MERKKLPERKIFVLGRHVLEQKRCSKVTPEMKKCEECGKEFGTDPERGWYYHVEEKLPHSSEWRVFGPCCYMCASKTITQVLRYGLWLRFAHEHFNPCEKCQLKIHEALFTSRWSIGENPMVYLNFDYGFESPAVFVFNFLSQENIMSHTEVELCKKCTDNLKDKVLNAGELNIGNKDWSIPPVELWRRWEIKE